MIYSSLADAATDDAVLRELTDLYGERVVALPPVALVIAAYDEEGAIGPVVAASVRMFADESRNRDGRPKPVADHFGDLGRGLHAALDLYVSADVRLDDGQLIRRKQHAAETVGPQPSWIRSDTSISLGDWRGPVFRL